MKRTKVTSTGSTEGDPGRILSVSQTGKIFALGFRSFRTTLFSADFQQFRDTAESDDDCNGSSIHVRYPYQV